MVPAYGAFMMKLLVLAALALSTLMGSFAIVAPPTLVDTPPFLRPGLYKLPDGSFEAYLATDEGKFYPSVIRVPAGSVVTFFVTSPRQIRGFAIPNTEAYLAAGPGWVKPVTVEFDKPDDYVVVCNEYCGLEHQGMHAEIQVTSNALR